MTKTLAALKVEVQKQQNPLTVARLRAAWIKSGAYRALSFRQWYDERTEELVNSWFKVA